MGASVDLASRPGLALGIYPESDESKLGVLDRFAAQGASRIRARWQSRAKEFAQVIEEIHACAEGLERMPDEILSMSISGLRLRLARDGWNRPLAQEAFALVREVADRTVGMRHHDSQILGGWVMFNGMLAEMQTGEGKTLTATLPASTAAIAGVPVHVITANDYLAARDAELMRPVYEALGLTVGVITEEMGFDQRKVAYACDITYCTNKQVAFDYLRDRVARGATRSRLHLKLERLYSEPAKRSRLMMRGLCYAIVDEADSVLIDEARTPLILSQSTDVTEEQSTYHDALELAARLTLDVDYTIPSQGRDVRLSDRGKVTLGELAESLGGIWLGKRRREELVKQALTAQQLFIRDRHYLVGDGKVKIIDDSTGRLMADRSWEQGLHQMVETKEGCELSSQKETLARISYQRFFRRYLRLSGMSGTVKEVAGELASVYGLNVVSIPTHRPGRRLGWAECVYARAEQRDRAVVENVQALSTQGRAVLVGTRSVLAFETLAARLVAAGVDTQILNARLDRDEAEVVAQAGSPGRVTVATNMAGRGTDIHLSDAVSDSGGLHVIVTEPNEAGRIDRQLIGRCARQGDPGSYQVFASLEDEIPSLYYPAFIVRLLSLLRTRAGPLPAAWGKRIIHRSQRAIERRHQRARRELERQDERLASTLAFAGQEE